MVESDLLSKILKEAMKSGKSVMGAKESLSAVKGSKAILCSKSIPERLGTKLREEAKKQSVPVVELSQTSAQLARMLGRPYKVSAVALRGVSEADVNQLLK